MPSLDIATRGVAAPSGHKRVTLKLGTEILTLPVTSEVVPHSEISPAWVEIPRPEAAPLLRRSNERLWKMQLTVLFVLPGGMTSVEPALITLHRFANHTAPILVGYSLFESGFWRITDMSLRSVRKHPDTNETVRAEVTLYLTREPDPPSTSAVAAPAPKAAAPAKAAGTPKRTSTPAARTYTVRSGDTLSGIAGRIYGHADYWPTIAKANKIKDPRRIKPGQVLTIPAHA